MKIPKIIPILVAIIGAVVFASILIILMKSNGVALLEPKGLIANEQNNLFITATLIMLGFGVPIILTLYFFVWKYRDQGQPTQENTGVNPGKGFLLFAWGGPLVVVAILASLMLPATRHLEPQKQIVSDKDQLTVQVVAMNWKWLFIYPEYDIASVNFVQIPVDTPVRFELTADEAPMNSFWIPHLGGMLYAMTGHVNPLHLMGDTIGDFPGGAAEINGRGLAGMRFTTRVSTEEEFMSWVEGARTSSFILDDAEYDKLLQPSENNEPIVYSNPTINLYDRIVSKYGGSHPHGNEHSEHGSH